MMLRAEGHVSTMERIVLGGDHTAAASAALRWAVREAAQSGACIVVVHAFDVTGRADLAMEGELERARRDARYRTQSWVVEVLGDLDTSVPVIISTPDGPVEQALASAARGARMVVIGRPEQGQYRDLASILARSCECPVVTVTGDHEAVAAAV